MLRGQVFHKSKCTKERVFIIRSEFTEVKYPPENRPPPLVHVPPLDHTVGGGTEPPVRTLTPIVNPLTFSFVKFYAWRMFTFYTPFKFAL